MRKFVASGSGVLALALMSASSVAQEKAATPPPQVACPDAVAAIATCYGAKLETGAYLLAAMPKSWNGNLIVFAHGGPSVHAPAENDSKDDLAKYSIGVKMGFAWIASTYRKEGYGVQMAADDTDDARKFFIDRIGKPKRTILHGASYGGLVGSKLIEKRRRELRWRVLQQRRGLGLDRQLRIPRRFARGLSILLQEPSGRVGRSVSALGRACRPSPR